MGRNRTAELMNSPSIADDAGSMSDSTASDVDPDDDEQMTGSGEVAQLPSAAAALVWTHLDSASKAAVYNSCKILREKFSPHVAGLTLLVPSDTALTSGYSGSGLPAHLLAGLSSHSTAPAPHLQLRLVRQMFNMQAVRRGCMSGDTPQHSTCHALAQLAQLLARSSGQLNSAPVRPLMACVAHLALQGFTLRGCCLLTGELAPRCSQLQWLTLQNADVHDGSWFERLAASAPALVGLRLSHMRLGAAAAASLDTSLATMTRLQELQLERVLWESTSVAESAGARIPGLAGLRSLRALELVLHPYGASPPSVALLISQLSGLSGLTSLKAWNLAGIQVLDGRGAAALAAACPQLVHLSFDRNVQISGVRELLALRGLTSLCARSLEPEDDRAPGEADGSEDPGDAGIAGSPASLATSRCSWRHLSLGAFRPSLTALAALPLHSLTHPFPLCELDLGGHPAVGPGGGDMAAVAAAVRAALANAVQHCRTLVFTSGKLEVAGAVGHGAQPLPDAAPALLALDVLRGRGVSHVKIVGLWITLAEVAALGDALRDCLTTITLCACRVTRGALHALTAPDRLSHLRQLSCGRHCRGAGLDELLQGLSARPADAPSLHVRLTRPVGVERPTPQDLLATEVDVDRARQQLAHAGQAGVTLELCGHIM